MDVFDVLLQAGLITTAIVAYLLVFRRETRQRGNYKTPGWNYPLKLLYARYAVYQWKKQIPRSTADEFTTLIPTTSVNGTNALCVRATSADGATILLTIRILYKPRMRLMSETNVIVTLPDGTTYVLPEHPESSVKAWEYYIDGWVSNGLKFQVLESQVRARITFNGLLKKVDDNTIRHVRFNFIWVAATSAIRHPEDWSNELAAQALAYEPWRDSNWPFMLGKYNDGSWARFGSMQGRFECYDEEGATDKSVYLQVRGQLEHSWAPEGYKGLRRSVRLTVATVDGTLVHLRCLSYNNVLTQCISGSIRHPDFTVGAITSTDLIMSDFAESLTEVPKLYSFNVSSKKRNLKVIIRTKNEELVLPSGVPYAHEVFCRSLSADIDGYPGSGILELGYEPTVVKEPLIGMPPARKLRWLSCMEAGAVQYCLSLSDRRAACADFVGGKGASLALLASAQLEEGYRVPPGFCLTINALHKHLEDNAAIKSAILEIEAANENYDESVFKQKCEAATALFIASDLSADVKEEILSNMAELRANAMEQNLGPDLRFAVRSSAVGEDSEVLSAAGQNQTILGCATDNDILNGVLKCWASMFAFTSSYYRRVNGQPCVCGGGVVVQALVSARAAGVMFTRHPAHGDPSRLLLTANFGLGESVVSGAIEPDTFIIKRGEDLSISKTILGTKTQRYAVNNSGVELEDVPASERETACLSEGEVMRLATLGVRQEELWGASRDIEWAIVGDDIFMLQARPITSLERWTEEELLHELDCPIMADDELISFGNTGEVVPRPFTAISYDIVNQQLTQGIDAVVGKKPETRDPSVVVTHHRCALQLFNSVYNNVPNEIDIGIRMIEMAIHGHCVADEDVLRSALHRHRPALFDKPAMIVMMLKSLLLSKRNLKKAIRVANSMEVGAGVSDPDALVQAVIDTEQTLQELSYSHAVTSTASTASQLIAMTVLLEGRTEFSPELCNEIGALLSSGDVLSAEVPQGLASFTKQLEASGRYDEFRALQPEDGMRWLEDNLPLLYKQVKEFLNKHGHRAVMEFELSTKPWALVPADMMKVLQSLRGTSETTHTQRSDADIIASLNSPQKSSTRRVLRWLMPLCRRTVRHREGTKAHLVLGIHKVRLALRRLGAAMVKQWLLPNEDLVFYFRLDELKEYIRNRNPALFRKASQRHQYYNSWAKLKFAEVNKGWPAPLPKREVAVTSGDVRIVAATVCGGDVIARACVVKDLSEIWQLQQGDILITHATDIGWSPYFPLIAGIVTELGGLISHGAVIAREYGLPCIVGATDATDLFRTGDTVRLSGTTGTLERVTLHDTPENEALVKED